MLTGQLLLTHSVTTDVRNYKEKCTSYIYVLRDFWYIFCLGIPICLLFMSDGNWSTVSSGICPCCAVLHWKVELGCVVGSIQKKVYILYLRQDLGGT